MRNQVFNILNLLDITKDFQKITFSNKMHQQSTNSLKQLKQFLLAYSSNPNKDPYWISILQSDIRNIIPKHQVCKIELVKNNLSKIRLIMQNLNTFISLQMHRKNLKQQMIDLNENTTKQLQEIIQQSNSHTDDIFYDTNLSLKRKQLQTLCKQFSKSKTSKQLKQLIKKNHKWQSYLDKNVKQLQKATQQTKHEDIMNLLQTYQSLFNCQINHISAQSSNSNQNSYEPSTELISQVILKSGSYTKLYENKLRQKILISKLVDSIFQDQQTTQDSNKKQNQQNDDYWLKQIKQIRADNGI